MKVLEVIKKGEEVVLKSVGEKDKEVLEALGWKYWDTSDLYSSGQTWYYCGTEEG